MAVMGVHINQPSGGVDTSLADTLAKALFGDPEREMKMAIARRQYETEALQQQQIQATTEYTAAQQRAAEEKAVRDQQVHNALVASGDVRGQEIYDTQFLGDKAPAPVEPGAVPIPVPRPVDTGELPAWEPPAPVDVNASGLSDTPYGSWLAGQAVAPPFTENLAAPVTSGGDYPIGFNVQPQGPLTEPPAPVEPFADPNVGVLPAATGDVVAPGETVDNGDGTVTHGASGGNVRLTREQADKLGLAAAFSNDPAGQAMKEAGAAGLIYNPNLTLTPTERTATLAGGGSAISGTSAASTEGGGFNENEQKMRKEYTARPEVQRFDIIQTRYKDLLKGAAQANGVGDTVMIYAMIKMLDPNSSVMGGEQVTAQNAPGLIPAQIVQFNNLLNMKGDKFDPASRKLFVKAAGDVFATNQADVQKVNDYFTRLATDNGLKPENIIFPLAAAVPPGWAMEEWLQLSAAEQQEVLDELAGRRQPPAPPVAEATPP